MIVFITNNDDQSSNKIIEWLDYFGYDYVRLNEGVDELSLKSIIIERNGRLSNSIPALNFLSGHSCCLTFFRRGHIWCSYSLENRFGLYKDRVNRHLTKEVLDLKEFLYSNLSLSEVNSPINNYRVNKLTALKIASASGLLIPKTIVTNDKNDLIRTLPCKTVICKPITDNLMLIQQGIESSHSPKKLSVVDIMNLPDKFGYSLFQELIDVKWEIRTFVFGEIIESIGIININNENENSKDLFTSTGHFKRIIPVKLPHEILKGIRLFMSSMSLFTGSIDILYSKDDNFYFLEINPVGQFDHVSYFGNFSLERRIAENLIKFHEERKTT